VFVDYFANHIIRDPDEPQGSSDQEEEAHLDPQPQPRTRSDPAQLPSRPNPNVPKERSTLVIQLIPIHPLPSE